MLLILVTRFSSVLRGHWRGLLAVLGAFLCQLCAGAYHGTFGNLLPYLTSYIRQVGLYTVHVHTKSTVSLNQLSIGWR